MPINQMAWVASSTSFLLVAVGSLREAPHVVPPVSVQTASQTATAVEPISQFSRVGNNSIASKPLNSATLSGSSRIIRSKLSGATTLISTHKTQLHQDNFFASGNDSPKQSLLSCPSSADKLWTKPVQGMFPVFFKGCPVAQLSSQAAAKALQQRLAALSQDTSLDWQQLQPDLVGTIPMVQIGQEQLFAVSSQLADRFDQHPQDLAVQWSNNIRHMMGVGPISMDIAQQRMYDLQETAQVIVGSASWYGPYFHGRTTANGETFNQYDLTAAHRDLPLGSFVKVTNRKNGRSVVVRINDRGPYYDEDQRVLDMSYQAARVLDCEEKGVVPIELTVLKPQIIPQQVQPKQAIDNLPIASLR